MTVENKAHPGPKASLFLVSGLKAKAFGAMEINLRFAEYLLNHIHDQDEIAYLLDNFSIHFIFVANPDGRAKAESQSLGDGDGTAITWTKNTNPGTCADGNGGVSLGLNFPFQWMNYPTDPCHDKYPGTSAASEPETQALMSYLETKTQNNSQAALLINLESWQDALITPYLYSKTHRVEQYDAYQILANKILYGATAIPLSGDNNLVEQQYGSLVDYAHDDLDMVALLYRIGREIDGGDIPYCGYFEKTLVHSAIQNLSNALRALPDPLVYAAGPQVLDLSFQPNDETQSFDIAGRLDPKNYYRNPRFGPYVISAHYSINLPPWHPDATKNTITNLSPNEQDPILMDFSFSVPYSSVPPSGIQIYIQGVSEDPQRDNMQDEGFIYRLNLKTIVFQSNLCFPMILSANP